MSEDRQSDFKRKFAAAFADPPIRSKRGWDAWLELMVVRDALAGPLYSVKESGGCKYVYARDDGYFSGVGEPATLLERLREWRDQLAEEIQQFVPASPVEAEDLASMQQSIDAIWAVAEEACDIEQARWQAENGQRSGA